MRRPAQQVGEHDPEGVQVGGRSQPTAGDLLLGGHVPRGPDNRTGRGRRSCHDLRDAEVGDFDQAAGVKQDVVRFDVAVQDVPAVGVGQRRGNRQADRAGGLRGHAGPPAGQRPPAQLLHDDQVQVVVGDVVVDPHHMWMIKGSEQLCFRREPRGRAVEVRHQNLDRNVAVQSTMSAGQHQPERAPAEDLAQLVAG